MSFLKSNYLSHNNTMEDNIIKLIVKEKGILAMDESNPTIGKRFATINLENTELNRQRYRTLLATTQNLSNYISGVILFEETLNQNLATSTNNPVSSNTIAKEFIDQGILVGIKVDQGLVQMYPNSEEKITKGLDLLTEKLTNYKHYGATFAKWRAVIKIDTTKNFPSDVAIHINAEQLANYASICQHLNLIPIVEPEVLMEGTHDLETCYDVTTKTLVAVFDALRRLKVNLEQILLKPNMVLPGKDCNKIYTTNDIASATIKVLKNTVPAAVPSVNFLSGGQTEDEATNNLNAINKLGIAPWHLSFSFGRALQESCIKTWQGLDTNTALAQNCLLARARLNSLANLGQKQ